jgi:hypothetical protein
MALAGTAIGLVTLTRVGSSIAMASLLIVLAGAAARALRLMSRGRVTPVLAIQTFAVALTYDLARALALVVRAGHGVRRK